MRELPHGFAVIDARLHGHQPYAVCRSLEPQRLTRDAEANLEFRTYAHPFDERAENIYEKRLALVPAVEPHLVPQQT